MFVGVFMSPVRKQIRLQSYDYNSDGAYFITICSHDRKCTFGTIMHGDVTHAPTVQLSALGETILENLQRIPAVYPTVRIEKSVIMPNHLHLFLIVSGSEGKDRLPRDKMLVSKVMQSFKASVTRQAGVQKPVWQERFHDHIVRDEHEFQRIWTYIDNNPASWLEDRYHV